eukprot:4685850-Prymnesium_polylepis.1
MYRPPTRCNHFGVAFKLRLPGKARQSQRVSVTEAEGDRPTFEAAVRSAIDWVNGELEKHGVEVNTAEQQEEQPPTAEELDWLAEWLDEQLAPEAVTIELADAAIAARRSASGSSQAGTSSAGSSSTGDRCNLNHAQPVLWHPTTFGGRVFLCAPARVPPTSNRSRRSGPNQWSGVNLMTI